MSNYEVEYHTVETPDKVNLSARVFKPKDKIKDNLVIVLVHPYSVLGGRQALLKGIATGDVIAVCNWVPEKLSSDRILLVGSSAGAAIAGSAVDQVEQVVGYVSLGYPFGMMASILFGRHQKAILRSTKPKLFVMGTQDGFTSVKQLENKLKSAAAPHETHLIQGVGHFEMEGPAYDADMVKLIPNSSTHWRSSSLFFK
ncbi:hypothetical protein V6N12_036987 [Hibiscus sabdariffa]|uniref:KANL3/Tex30 alpha/beta hydrolase-like domain-containing protein n=1 Tax=Hibiscus sabdariffa TaxID=183260 RepID=A0ABR2AYG7_9ROSI